MRRFQKILLSLLAISLMLAAGLLMLVKTKTYKPTSTASQIAQEAKMVDHSLYFKAKGKTKATVIFFQGALVEEEAYAPLAADLSQEGIAVYLLDAPLNLALLSGHRTAELKNNLANVPVYLAGHSLGGVVAAQTVEDFSKTTKGLILLASYPSEKTDLSDSQLKVLSIRASKDKVLNQEAYRDARKLLPEDTQYTTVSGGNHAGFGDYSKQSKDGKATISETQQRQKIVQTISDFIQANENDTE